LLLSAGSSGSPTTLESYASKKMRVTGSLKRNTITVQNVEAID
jgi:hypothetical protein